MASSLPPALDYLHDKISTLPELAGAVVSDGWPAQRGDELVAIGVTPDGDDSEVAVDYAELSREENEAVELPGVITVYRAGDGAVSDARVRAFAILDAINRLIRSDRRLNGAIRTGLPARLSGYRMSQTSTAKQAGEGRTCRIHFTISWQHRG